MVPFEKSAKILDQKRYQLRNLRKFGNKNGTIREKYEKSPLKRYHFGKRQSFATKKGLLEKSKKNKTGTISVKSQNSATKVVPFWEIYLLCVEKWYLSFGKNLKSHTRNHF